MFAAAAAAAGVQGTMTHMAPEVMLRGKLSRQSDVYAFGVLLWELYSGGHAFKVCTCTHACLNARHAALRLAWARHIGPQPRVL